MKMRNQVLRVLLGLVLTVAFVSTANTEVRAELKTQESVSNETVTPNTASGKWGDLKWEVSGSTLKITGSGEMEKRQYHSSYPWAKYDTSIETIVIGNSVTSIAYEAFAGMKFVDEVTIGSRVTDIYNEAFSNCDGLSTITIPKNVTHIWSDAFWDCDNLVSVDFASDSKLEKIDAWAFAGNDNLSSVKLPESVKYLATGAFEECRNLIDIQFNEKLEIIYEEAFRDCDNLIEIDLPKSIRKIGKSAFSDCDSLKYVDIKNGVEEIGDYAFNSCECITDVVNIPKTVTTLGESVFKGCSNIKEANIYCATDISVSAFENCSSLSKIKIGSKVTGIGNKSFKNTKLVSVSVPASVSYIGSGAFCGIESLTKVSLTSGLIEIRRDAFSSTSITNMLIPDTCVSIGKWAFSNCSALKKVDLGAHVTTIESEAFYNCNNLSTVTMKNELTMIGESAFENCTLLENVTWSENLNSIGKSAFENCQSLKSVIFPENLSSIGSNAFYNCTLLSNVETGGRVTSIGNYAFAKCNLLTEFKCYSGKMELGVKNVFENSPVIIYCWPDSSLEQYATKYSIPFVAIKTLDIPTNKKVENDVSGVRVSWHAVRGASYYTVYRSTSLGGNYTVVKNAVAGLSYTDTSAKSGTTYFYKVKANNTYATSDLSEAQKITYVAASKITSCTNLSSGIKVEWKKVSGATGYAIYRKTSKGSWARVYTAKSGSTSSWIDKSIKSKNGTTYKYAIRALKGNVLSGCDTTGKTIVRLTNRTLKSVTKASKTSIKCKWTKSSSVTGYQIRVMQNGKVVKTVTVKDKNTATKTITGLKSGKKYQVQVRSYKTVSSKKYYSAWSTKKTVKL